MVRKRVTKPSLPHAFHCLARGNGAARSCRAITRARCLPRSAARRCPA